jgi:MFS family permease
MDKLDKKIRWKAYTIFFLASCFYLYEFILQVAPSVMAEPMMKTFHITAEGFGIISAFYFYAYAPMQLPAGLMFDRFGPRRLMTFALLLCAFGSFFFASTDSVITAALGRFMIGIGSAFSFIGVLVLCSRWFPAHYFAILAGVAQLMSSVGAIFGEMPLAWLIKAVGWREASFILALIGIALSGLLFKLVKDYPDGHEEFQTGPGLKVELQRLMAVCGKGYTWIIGTYAFSIWTPIAVFAALWGVPYLQEKFQISVVAASGMCSIIWIGIGIGSPLLGWLSDRLENRRIALGLSSAMGLIATLFILYDGHLTYSMAYFMLFLFGLGAGGQSVSFAVVRDYNPPQLVGTASGFNNLSVLIGGSIFQPLVGILLNHSHQSHLVNGIPVYSVDAYQNALIVMPVCYFVSLMIVLFVLKESHPGREDVGFKPQTLAAKTH